MPALSAVIITYNEERNIARCLDSLQGIADEIVVLDSFSTDRTPEICRAYGVRWEQHVFDGHIQQKNRALALAAHDFVLSLDADEALSPALRTSIERVKQLATPADGYEMNRLTNYCGQWIRHSGWYPDRKLRLVDRRKARWGGRNPHDKMETAAGAKVERLTGDLWHYSYYTVEEHVLRARKYAEISAQAMKEAGKKGYWYHLALNPALKWVRNYLFKLGFLDGKNGWVICRISAWETYLKYKILIKN